MFKNFTVTKNFEKTAKYLSVQEIRVKIPAVEN